MPLNDLVCVKIINSTKYWMCTHIFLCKESCMTKVEMFFVDFTLCGVFFNVDAKGKTLR